MNGRHQSRTWHRGRTLVAAAAAGLLAAGVAAQTGEDPEAARLKAESDARWEQLQAESRARIEAERAARERYEQGVREAEAARQQYEAGMARHQEEVRRAEEAQAAYDRQMEAYNADPAAAGRAADKDAPAQSDAASATGTEGCEARTQRNRRRGRAIGGLVGGLAGGLVGGSGAERLAAIALSAPVGALIGDAIAGLLDCEEQRQAAAATEEAVRGGVGTTTTWESDSREGVTGASTVVAHETEAGGGECLTVTDIVIIDGEETRAPKRMCRRPPSSRYVRV